VGKVEIHSHLDAISRLGLYFKRVKRVVRKGNVEEEIDKYVRKSVDDRFIDAFGNPDDESAMEHSKSEYWFHIKLLKAEMDAEIESRVARGVELPKGLKTLHDYEERDWFVKCEWAYFDKALGHVLYNFRLLGLDVAHDQFYKSTVVKSGVAVGQKMLSEGQASSYGGGSL